MIRCRFESVARDTRYESFGPCFPYPRKSCELFTWKPNPELDKEVSAATPLRPFLDHANLPVCKNV